jgi:hypothetical protein
VRRVPGRERVDDLYEPTLGDVARSGTGARPWNLDSQGYVAFFGGPLAAATIGILNGRRLGLVRDALLAIAGIGAAGLVGAVLIQLALGGEGRAPRLVLAGTGVLCYVAIRRLQKRADRLYRMHPETDDVQPYESLWGPGLLVVVVCGLVSIALVEGIV